MPNTLELEILDDKILPDRSWYLCKAKLLPYLGNLKDSFYEYAIQRRIVKNQYLDALYNTIKIKDPIPIITLTYNSTFVINDDRTVIIDMNNVEILDGLQRSYRLWAYKFVFDKFHENDGINTLDFIKLVKEQKPSLFETGVMSSTIIKKFISEGEINHINDRYTDFDIYFIIWVGLTDKQVVDKMLVLNAGQKSVTKTHQFELLFLHIYYNINQTQDRIQLYREKDPLAYRIKKGDREIGHFMFSSIIVSLQSLVEKRPLRISTDGLLGLDKDEKKDLDKEYETPTTIFESVFSSDFITIFLEKLYLMDEKIFGKDSENGKEWFVKDTTLSGVFAAIGLYINIKEDWEKAYLIDKFKSCVDQLNTKIDSNGLNLPEFTSQYNVLSSREVNIGNFIRKVIMTYILKLLKEQPVNWEIVFNEVKLGGRNER